MLRNWRPRIERLQERYGIRRLAPLGILVGWIGEDGIRRDRGGEPYTAEKLATCRLFINFGHSEAELKAQEAELIADGRIEGRNERVPPSEGYDGPRGMKELPPPSVN